MWVESVVGSLLAPRGFSPGTPVFLPSPPPPPPVWPGFDSRTRRHMRVEFVVGSLLAPRGFSPGTPVFLPSPPPPPPVWPGFDSRTRRHMWVEFVVGSVLAPRGFSPGTPVFLPPPPPLPHQCRPGSIPGPGVICGLSLLLVLSSCSKRFFFGYKLVFLSPQKPTFPYSNSIRNPRATGLSVKRLVGATLVKRS